LSIQAAATLGSASSTVVVVFWNDGNESGMDAQCRHCEWACVTKVGAGMHTIKQGIRPKLVQLFGSH
jgi:hypothetical protein